MSALVMPAKAGIQRGLSQGLVSSLRGNDKKAANDSVQKSAVRRLSPVA
jgi:hypothetical protein